MRATRGLLGGLVLAALAWCGSPSAHADAGIVRVFDAPGWGAISDIAADPGMDRVTVVGRYATSAQTYEISTGRLVKSVQGNGFLAVAVNPATHRVYVSQQYAGIKVLDSVTGDLLEEIIPPDGGGAVHDLVVDPRTNRLYMLRDKDESPFTDDLKLLALDASGLNPHANLGVVSTGLTGMPWSHLAINSDTGRLYVARGDAGQPNHGGGTLAVFDAATLARVASIPLGSTKLSSIAVNHATNKVYVGLWSDGVAVVDGAANTLLRTIATKGGFPACNSLTNRIYLADPAITVIDGSTDAVVGSLAISAVGGVYGGTLDETTGQVLVHTGDDKLYVIEDVSPPGLVVPAPIVRECDTPGGGATVNFVVEVTGSPPASAILKVVNATNETTLLSAPAVAGTFGVGPVVFDEGSSTVEVRILDGDREIAFKPFTVQVRDTVPPVLAMAGPRTIECLGHTTPVTPEMIGITATDACDLHPTVTLVPSLLGLGTTTVVVTASDGSGNTSTVEIAVTVVDTTAPFFTITPADVSRACEGESGATVAFDIRAGDLCGEVTIASLDETGRTVDPAGTVFTVGTHTVTCTATDSSGNFTSVSFAVTIVDDDDPALVCPGDITAPTDAGKATAAVSFTVTATDACDTQVTITCTAPWGEVHSGDAFPLGLTTVICTAQDHSGNEVTGSFRILVVDREAPVITAPSTASLVTDCAGSPPGITPALLGVTAVDNADPSPRLACSPSSLSPGTTTVDCTATDAAGNVAHVSVTVTVLRGPFQVRFLRPLDPAVDNLIKAGRTVPLKIRVACDNRVESGATVTLDRIDRIDGTGSPIANIPFTASQDDECDDREGDDHEGDDHEGDDHEGSQFEFDDGHYQFELRTRGFPSTAGARFRVTVRVRKTGHADTLAEIVLKNK